MQTLIQNFAFASRLDGYFLGQRLPYGRYYSLGMSMPSPLELCCQYSYRGSLLSRDDRRVDWPGPSLAMMVRVSVVLNSHGTIGNRMERNGAPFEAPFCILSHTSFRGCAGLLLLYAAPRHCDFDTRAAPSIDPDTYAAHATTHVRWG